MTKRDSLLTLAAATTVAIFAIPTLINTQLYEKLPFPLLLLFIGFPLASFVGMSAASLISRKIAFAWQVSKFAMVGVLNTAIDFGILNFLIATTDTAKGFGIILINATSFSVALINSYFWNKEWVFGVGRKSNFPTFAAVTLIGLSINTGAVYLLTTYMSPIIVTSDTLWANLAKVLATGLSLTWNFLGYKLIVFRR